MKIINIQTRIFYCSFLVITLLVGCSHIPPDKYAGKSLEEQLSVAIDNGDVAMATCLLDSGMANAKSNYVGTTNNKMQVLKDTELTRAVEKGNKSMVLVLLDHGADPNATLVMITAFLKLDENIIRLLVSKGGKVPANLIWSDGATLLFFAYKKEVAEILVAAGSDVNAKDRRGMTPLYKRSTNIGAVEYRDGLLQTMEFLIERGADVNAKTQSGDSSLHQAVQFNDRRFPAMLLRHGADINIQDGSGRTPLYLAIESGNQLMVQDLLKLGANVRIADKSGTTPLHLSTKLTLSDVSSALIARGANPNARDALGNTPAMIESIQQAEQARRRAQANANASRNASYEDAASVQKRMAAEARADAARADALNQQNQPSFWDKNASTLGGALKTMQDDDAARRAADARRNANCTAGDSRSVCR